MRLNQYAAEKRLAIFEELRNGRPPSEGSFDARLHEEGKVKGQPQMGTTRYEPGAIILEFIYPDPGSSATVLPVRLEAPERIVYMPVPDWVVESIWQGEIDGSYHFESDAAALLEEFRTSLDSTRNPELFGAKMATGRS